MQYIYKSKFQLNISINMNKSLLLLAIGSIVVAAFSFYKLNEQRKKSKKQGQDNKNKISNKSLNNSNDKAQQGPDYALNSSQIQQDGQDRALYQEDITQNDPYKIILEKPTLNPDIDQLHYNIILSVNKSKGYEGVVKIKIISNRTPINNRNLYINYAGSAILYLGVNGRKIKQQQVIFKKHKILIKQQWLVKHQNYLQIIFANKYGFMGDGLTCYFPLDEFNKYSLKGQVVYIRNGFNKIPRIIPCLNILNPCQVSLEVLHPNGFNTESNNHKMQLKVVSKKDYPNYQFLFYASNSRSLNKSYRLNNSVISDSGSFRASDEIVKAKSQFSPIKLTTIHDFFLFSSAIVEIRPAVNLSNSTESFNSLNDSALKNVLIRYFSKEHLVKKATSFLSILQSQIVQIFKKIQQYKKTYKLPLKYHCKIDIFFVDDLKAEGDFYSGSILLCQKTIQRGMIDRRLYFLLSRAFVGMGLLNKKQDSLLTLEGMLKLNQLTLQIFNQCADYLYVKNKQYQNIRNYAVKLLKTKQQNIRNNKLLISQQQEREADMQYWIVDYYQKQCRYFIKNFDKFDKFISSNVKNIIQNLSRANQEDYWTYFIARYPFIEFNVSQVLLKISLNYKGIPKGQAEFKYAKQNFIKSKYYIKFFTQKQVQTDLKRFMQLQTHGIQKMLPFIKIKQSFLAAIPQQLQGYLYAKQNRLDAKKLYQQFKKYNEGNNFHHISALRRQIKRIKLLARQHIQFQRKDIHCGLMGWKLLQKLKIFPQDEETFRLIKKLEGIKQNSNKSHIKQQQVYQIQQNDAKKLQKLLQQGTQDK